MKYMNNHFGQSRIFGRAHCKMPMNLQLFGYDDGGDGSGAAGGGDSENPEDNSSGDNIPSVEELMAQLSAERAKNAKLQNEKDNASSEAANFKKQLRQKMTADEQAEAAKAEAEARRDAEFQQMKEEIRINKYSKRYMGIGMDETTATELAVLTGEIAEPDKFFSSLDKFIKAAAKKAGEDSVQNLIKNNPGISAGNGSIDGESLAVRKAKELASRKSGGINEDILKNFM